MGVYSVSDNDSNNVHSLGDKRRSNFLNSEEGQELMGNAFAAVRGKQMARPLTFDEKENQRQYCQWQARILHEKIERGYLEQDAEIEYARDTLASEIRDVRNNWTNNQWREFVEQGGDLPATTYASSRAELNEYIEQMREEWKANMAKPADPEDERDLMWEKRDFESQVFEMENISLKHWNERHQVAALVSEVLNTPVVDRIQKRFEQNHDTATFIAMTEIRNLYNADRRDEGEAALSWALENERVTEYQAGLLRKGQMPLYEGKQENDEPDHDEPVV